MNKQRAALVLIRRNPKALWLRNMPDTGVSSRSPVLPPTFLDRMGVPFPTYRFDKKIM